MLSHQAGAAAAVIAGNITTDAFNLLALHVADWASALVHVCMLPGVGCCFFGRAACIAGGKDILADPEDTIILLHHLPKVQAHHHEPSYGMCVCVFA